MERDGVGHSELGIRTMSKIEQRRRDGCGRIQGKPLQSVASPQVPDGLSVPRWGRFFKDGNCGATLGPIPALGGEQPFLLQASQPIPRSDQWSVGR